MNKLKSNFKCNEGKFGYLKKSVDKNFNGDNKNYRYV